MMKKIRYALEAFVLLIFLIISKLMPAHWASGLGGFIGRTVGPRLATSRKAFAHIKYAMPDTTDERAHEIIKGMWDNLGRTMLEYPHLAHIGREHTVIEGVDILERYCDQPAILVSGHLANWECLPLALFMHANVNSNSIYRAPNNPFSDYMLHRARSYGGKINTIPKSRSGTRNIVRLLNNNEYLGFLIDQKYNEGIAADFFGKPAMTSPIFAQLAQKYDCPIIPIRIERTSECNFKVTVNEPLEIENKTPEDIIGLTHALLEAWISERPDQWLWVHKRWGKIPKEKLQA